MRHGPNVAIVLVFVFVLASLVACGTDPAVPSDVGTDASLPDAHLRPDVGTDAGTDACALRTCPAYRCQVGVLGHRVESPTCGVCNFARVTPSPCARGCRDGLADTADALCVTGPSQVGDPCHADADCMPAADVDDGFGGTEPAVLTCDLVRFVCVRAPHETCDGTDDDLDMLVDEGCACSPRRLGTPIGSPIGTAAWFGGDRILLQSWSDLGSRLDWCDADGGVIRAPALTPTDTFLSIARGVGEFVILQVDPRILHVADDGTTRHRMLADTRMAAVGHPWGASYARIATASRSTGSWEVVRWDGDPPMRGASGTLTTTPASDLLLAELTSGGLFWLELGPGDVLRGGVIDATLAAHETAPATPHWTANLLDIAVAPTRLWVGAWDDAGAASLVSIDRATGAWAETIPLGAIHAIGNVAGVPAPIRVTFADTRLVASWIDPDHVLRVVVHDETGARVGRSSLALAPALNDHWNGATDRGVRVVASNGAAWQVIDPCAAPP